MQKVTDKQFLEMLHAGPVKPVGIFTRSNLKHWKKDYYKVDRVETPSQYYMRIASHFDTLRKR